MSPSRRRFAPSLVACALTALVAMGCGSDDDPAPPVETPGSVPIAQARARPSGETVTVEGFVTVAPGTFSSATGEQGFAIQDDSAGIYVSLPSALELALDAKVRVTGKLEQVAQQTVLSTDPSSVTPLAGSGATSPRVVTTGGVNESIEGLLVRVSGRVTKPIVDEQPYGFEVYIDDGSGETQVYVHVVNGAPVVDVASLQVGQTIEAIGLAAQYEMTYEVAPRKPDDLVKSAM